MLEDIKKLVGDRIRQLRKARGYSQEKLADKAELHYTHIGSIERGEKNWSIETLVKVANGLNVEVSDLFQFPLQAAEAKKIKKSLIEEINLSSPETIKILSDLLSGLKSFKR